jgi:pimeloyl-ACP methyl ester carboxylesterase
MRTVFTIACAAAVMLPNFADAQSARTSLIAVDTGVALEVLDWGGSGRPVVLLAGNGQTAHSFDDFAPKLAQYYHVYGITRRGFGGSSKPATGYRTDRRADDVLAVMDSLRIERPVLAGHSMGGEELSSISNRHAERAAGFVYLDATGGLCDGTRCDFITEVAELKYDLEQLRAAGGRGQNARVDSLLTVLLETDLPLVQQTMLGMRNASRQLPPVVSYSLMPPPTTGVARLIDDGRQHYSTVRGPVLAFFAVQNPPAGVGTDSTLTRRWLERNTETPGRFARLVPRARIVILPNANHFVFRSNEQDVLSAMRPFIDALPR